MDSGTLLPALLTFAAIYALISVLIVVLARRRRLGVGNRVWWALGAIWLVGLASAVAYVAVPGWFQGPLILTAIVGLSVFVILSAWPIRQVSPSAMRLIGLVVAGLVVTLLLAFLDLSR